MKLTRENLNSRWISNEMREYFIDNPELLDREILDLCKKNLLPAEIAADILQGFDLTSEEENALEKAAYIVHSNNIYKSYFVSNSNSISNSHNIKHCFYVKRSNQVIDSNYIIDSFDVDNSYNVYKSQNVVDSRFIMLSNDIDNCYYVYGIKKGYNNSIVIDGQDISNCHFCRFDPITIGAHDCILSTKMCGDYTILNHSVNSKDYQFFYESFIQLIENFETNNYWDSNAPTMWVNPINFFSCYNNMAIWRNIISILPFKITYTDLVTLYSITLISDFLTMKI